MKKNIISLIIAVLIVFVFGFAELAIVINGYAELTKQLSDLLVLADNETITETEIQTCYNYWEHLREISEFWLNHNDINEINMRMAECMSYVRKKDFSQVRMQINVMLFFAEFIPKALQPTLENIF
ncbi:MAG: DUF4363 family protein [Clostridia bacterium]